MKRFCLFVVLALSAVALRAEDKPKAEIPAAGADGWITLFNGKDLTGWEGLEGYWSVEDGAITCKETKATSKQSDLILSCSKDNPEKFADFELRYSWKMVTKEGNSGMQFRGKVDRPNDLHVGGYQADIDAGNGYTGIIYDEGGVAGGRNVMSERGDKTVWDKDNKRHNEKLSESKDDIKKAIKPIGEWNEAVVVADGNHITYTLNGHLTTDLTDDSPKACKNGVIAMQMHAGFTMTIQFKDVKIKMIEKK